LTNISSKDPQLRRSLADQVRDACLNVGFFYGIVGSDQDSSGFSLPVPVKNHGIPDETIAQALAGEKAFFALPLDTKLEVSPEVHAT
jgi:isopenicillin N synthase-like dioxygenase